MSEKRVYTKAEIRMMRIFVIALIAIGSFNLLMGLLSLDKWPKDMSVAYTTPIDSESGRPLKISGKGPGYAGNIPLMYLVGAVVFLSLGIAGAVAITRVIKNSGKDLEFDPVDEKCT